MDDLAAFRERYPLQTMRLPDGEPFAYRYHRNPSARATIVLLPGGIGLSDCSACILNGSPRTARSSPSIIRSGSRRTPNWRVPAQVEADACLIPMPLHRRLMAWAVMRKTQDMSSGERRLMQGLCDVLKQLLSKPYQRHMADLLIDAASHADMVTAVISRCWCAWTSTWIPYAPSSGRMRPALSRRP